MVNELYKTFQDLANSKSTDIRPHPLALELAGITELKIAGYFNRSRALPAPLITIGEAPSGKYYFIYPSLDIVRVKSDQRFKEMLANQSGDGFVMLGKVINPVILPGQSAFAVSESNILIATPAGMACSLQKELDSNKNNPTSSHIIRQYMAACA